jgi:hypothetical protein
VKKLLSSAVAIASVIGVCALPSQVSAGVDGSSGDILGIAGSDTTTFVMDALASAHNTNSRYNKDKDRAVNIPPLVAANPSVENGEYSSRLTLSSPKDWLAAARSTWPGGVVLPADSDCPVNMVFGGYGSRDSNSDGDTADGAVSAGLFAEGGISVTADLGGATAGAGNDVGETWYLGLVPPNGSSNGATAVAGTGNQNGVWYNGPSSPGGTDNSACLDIARSSSKQTDSARAARLEGWAFALDAIDWTYFSGNTHGVATRGLTKTELGNIYNCHSTANVDLNTDGDLNDVGDRKKGYPIWRFWGDVNGISTDTTPIAAYRVQVGSGTGSDVATQLIGKAGNTDAQFLANCDSASNDTDSDAATTFTFPQVQEHDCRNVSDANKPDAICFYGYSRWVIQAKALETDKRNGAVFGKFAANGTLKRPSFSSINETSSRFEGTRYVYNYVGLNTDGTGEDLPGIADSRRFVGVTAQPADCADGSEVAVVADPSATPPVVAQSAVDCNFDGDTVDTGVTVGGVPGFVCGDLTARKIIATYGLKPLPMGATDPANGALGQSYCRKATGSNPGF